VADATPLAPTIGVCNGCTIVYQAAPPTTAIEQTIVQEVYVEPIELVRRHERPRRPQIKTEGICQRGVDCPPGTGTPAKAILTMSPIRRREPVTQEVAVPLNPGLAPGVSKTVIVPAPVAAPQNPEPALVVVRTGSRFSTGRGLTAGARETPPQPRATRTIALPRSSRSRD
jgi:hypothetical protein